MAPIARHVTTLTAALEGEESSTADDCIVVDCVPSIRQRS
jgi:hypothetical protein